MEEAVHTGVLILHVLGAAIIVGAAFVTLLIELKHFSSKQILTLTEFIWKVAGAALGVQLITGIYLAGSEWEEVGKNPFLWIKLFVFFVIGTVVGMRNRNRFKKMQEGKEDTAGSTWAWLGFLTFALIAVLGVLIAETAS